MEGCDVKLWNFIAGAAMTLGVSAASPPTANATDLVVDEFGAFGTPGANLAGAKFTAVYTMHLPQDWELITASPVQSFDIGNETNAVITIRRVGQYVDGTFDGSSTASFSFLGGQFSGISFDLQEEGFVNPPGYPPGWFPFLKTGVSSGGNPGMTWDFIHTLHHVVNNGDVASGEFLYQAIDQNNNGKYLSEVLSLSPESFTIEGVPEPATWAMMLVGFYSLGAMVRGARRTRGNATA
jgi:hypothetical protein